ncbi:hypothetical protein GQ42DRAFT_158548 [Ramicandelaber brevisporus]|nr:hypothetical protein GQ42DRAFT_158548 [Ramicandelaber brevisporus]
MAVLIHHIRRILAAVAVALLLCGLRLVSASLRLEDTNSTFPLYDFYGETDPRPYNFTGQLVKASFVPNRRCVLEPRLSAINSTTAAAGVAILVDGDELINAGCASFSWALRSLPRYYPGSAVPFNTTTVMIFVSADDSTVAFGCKEIDVLDDYWYAVPSRVQLALIGSDTGKMLSKSIALSPSGQLSVTLAREGGPWTEFRDSIYLAVYTWLIRIFDGVFALLSLVILFLSYTTSGAGPVGWLKPAMLLTVFYFGLVNILCQMQRPDPNWRIVWLYTAFMIGNGVFSLLIVRWSAFMRRLGGYKVPYYILLSLCAVNIAFFSAAMFVSIAAVYSPQQNLRHVGFLMYTTLGTALFLAEAIVVCYAGYLYIGYLRSLTASPGIVRLLQFETASLFIFCIGRMLVSVSTVMLAAKRITTMVEWYVMNGSYHIGVFMLLGGLNWMFWLQLDHKTAYGNYNPSTDKSGSRQSTTVHGTHLSSQTGKVGRCSTNTGTFYDTCDYSNSGISGVSVGGVGDPTMPGEKTHCRNMRLMSLPEDDLLYPESIAESTTHQHRYPPTSRTVDTQPSVRRHNSKCSRKSPPRTDENDDDGDIDGTVMFSTASNVSGTGSSVPVRTSPSHVTIDSFLDELYNNQHVQRQQAANMYSLPSRTRSPSLGTPITPLAPSNVTFQDQFAQQSQQHQHQHRHQHQPHQQHPHQQQQSSRSNSQFPRHIL